MILEISLVLDAISVLIDSGLYVDKIQWRKHPARAERLNPKKFSPGGSLPRCHWLAKRVVSECLGASSAKHCHTRVVSSVPGTRAVTTAVIRKAGSSPSDPDSAFCHWRSSSTCVF